MELVKEKRRYFLYCLFCLKEIFLTSVFISMHSVLNITPSQYKYFYISKNILHTLFCLLLKSWKTFSVFLVLEAKFGDHLLVKLTTASHTKIFMPSQKSSSGFCYRGIFIVSFFRLFSRTYIVLKWWSYTFNWAMVVPSFCKIKLSQQGLARVQRWSDNGHSKLSYI